MTTQGQGEVHIDWESIRPGAEVTGRAVVRFRPRPPWPVGAGPRDLLKAVDGARVTASEVMFEIVEVYDVAPSPDGPVLVIEDGDPGEKRVWLAEVARVLAEGGWSGTLEQAPARSRRAPASDHARWPPRTVATKCGSVTSTGQTPAGSSHWNDTVRYSIVRFRTAGRVVTDGDGATGGAVELHPGRHGCVLLQIQQ